MKLDSNEHVPTIYRQKKLLAPDTLNNKKLFRRATAFFYQPRDEREH